VCCHELVHVHVCQITLCPFLQTVDDYSEVEMVRKVGNDGMAQEEYNFNSEVSLGDQVSRRLGQCLCCLGHLFCRILYGKTSIVQGNQGS